VRDTLSLRQPELAAQKVVAISGKLPPCLAIGERATVLDDGDFRIPVDARIKAGC
jgi:hypothetical protein